jgi:carbamoyl-phosphate synthase large subunit
LELHPSYKSVDTCAAEFEAFTPYYYSSYDAGESEHPPGRKPRAAVLGGGPNRIGQGIEFDYCCVHASMALRELGYESIMINSNPETVSTDYDVSDHLFFEPLTSEDVIEVCRAMKPEGVIVQFGGQTPLNLAKSLQEAGIRILGTSLEQIDRAEDRGKFKEMIESLGLLHTPSGTASNYPEAERIADQLGYPVLLRPSYVLGGRAMAICYDAPELEHFLKEASEIAPEHPVLIDKFLEEAIEVDADAVADGHDVFVGGLLEHIEMAGVHSGDASMTLPPYSLSDSQVKMLKQMTRAIALELEVRGLVNIQFAVKGSQVWVLEVNPRGSRTVPFVSKAIGIPLARIAARVCVGQSLKEIGIPSDVEPSHFSVKASVFPFQKFSGVDILLGPEMKSTGEVMGMDPDFGAAYAKALLGVLGRLPTSGNVFVSVKDSDKRDVVYLAKRLEDLGFHIYATSGTARVLGRHGVAVKTLFKIKEGRPNALDLIINEELSMVINTPSGKGPKSDEGRIRSAAVAHSIPVITTIPGAQAAVHGLEALQKRRLSVRALQEYHAARVVPSI